MNILIKILINYAVLSAFTLPLTAAFAAFGKRIPEKHALIFRVILSLRLLIPAGMFSYTAQNPTNPAFQYAAVIYLCGAAVSFAYSLRRLEKDKNVRALTLLACAASSLHFFNPLVRIALKERRTENVSEVSGSVFLAAAVLIVAASGFIFKAFPENSPPQPPETTSPVTEPPPPLPPEHTLSGSYDEIYYRIEGETYLGQIPDLRVIGDLLSELADYICYFSPRALNPMPLSSAEELLSCAVSRTGTGAFNGSELARLFAGKTLSAGSLRLWSDVANSLPNHAAVPFARAVTAEYYGKDEAKWLLDRSLAILSESVGAYPQFTVLPVYSSQQTNPVGCLLANASALTLDDSADGFSDDGSIFHGTVSRGWIGRPTTLSGELTPEKASDIFGFAIEAVGNKYTSQNGCVMIPCVSRDGYICRICLIRDSVAVPVVITDDSLADAADKIVFTYYPYSGDGRTAALFASGALSGEEVQYKTDAALALLERTVSDETPDVTYLRALAEAIKAAESADDARLETVFWTVFKAIKDPARRELFRLTVLDLPGEASLKKIAGGAPIPSDPSLYIKDYVFCIGGQENSLLGYTLVSVPAAAAYEQFTIRQPVVTGSGIAVTPELYYSIFGADVEEITALRWNGERVYMAESGGKDLWLFILKGGAAVPIETVSGMEVLLKNSSFYSISFGTTLSSDELVSDGLIYTYAVFSNEDGTVTSKTHEIRLPRINGADEELNRSICDGFFTPDTLKILKSIENVNVQGKNPVSIDVEYSVSKVSGIDDDEPCVAAIDIVTRISGGGMDEENHKVIYISADTAAVCDKSEYLKRFYLTSDDIYTELNKDYYFFKYFYDYVGPGYTLTPETDPCSVFISESGKLSVYVSLCGENSVNVDFSKKADIDEASGNVILRKGPFPFKKAKLLQDPALDICDMYNLTFNTAYSPSYRAVHSFKFPQITVRLGMNDGAVKLNEKLEADFAELFGDTLDALYNGVFGRYPEDVYNVSYSYTERGGIFAIIIKIAKSGAEGEGPSNYLTYYYDREADAVLTLDEYLNRFGFTKETAAASVPKLLYAGKYAMPGYTLVPDDIYGAYIGANGALTLFVNIKNKPNALRRNGVFSAAILENGFAFDSTADPMPEAEYYENAFILKERFGAEKRYFYKIYAASPVFEPETGAAVLRCIREDGAVSFAVIDATGDSDTQKGSDPRNRGVIYECGITISDILAAHNTDKNVQAEAPVFSEISLGRAITFRYSLVIENGSLSGTAHYDTESCEVTLIPDNSLSSKTGNDTEQFNG